MITPEEQRKISYLLGYVECLMQISHDVGFKKEDFNVHNQVELMKDAMYHLCPTLKTDDDEMERVFGHLHDIHMGKELAASMDRLMERIK